MSCYLKVLYLFSCMYQYVCFCVCSEMEVINSQINPDRCGQDGSLSCSERSVSFTETSVLDFRT